MALKVCFTNHTPIHGWTGARFPTPKIFCVTADAYRYSSAVSANKKLAMNALIYLDYVARITLDTDTKAFHGRVLGMKDVLSFRGKTFEELEQAFHEPVDEYLAWCSVPTLLDLNFTVGLLSRGNSRNPSKQKQSP